MFQSNKQNRDLYYKQTDLPLNDKSILYLYPIHPDLIYFITIVHNLECIISVSLQF